MNGFRTRRLVLITASAALAVGTVSLSSSAFAAPRAAGTPTASVYTGDDSPDPDNSGSGQDTDTADNGTGGHATGGDPVYRLVKSIKRTLRSDHPTSYVGETPAKQRTYTTKSSPAVRSSGVVLWF
ncbi:hypothetical protein ACFQ7Z_30815 [Streptomyces virginiae]|uniref:hypothetical protein n=1 Tax=Streptomyces virginiae TaxID=1961 RepID=UPI00367D59D6